jgi:FHS family L-fucose permease-like MFS transporter
MSSPVDEKQPVAVAEKKKGLFRPHSLRVGDRITNASQLTLRETIWPLFLVTILYFLWVRFTIHRAHCFDLDS